MMSCPLSYSDLLVLNTHSGGPFRGSIQRGFIQGVHSEGVHSGVPFSNSTL
jgi:hypothetical protein